MRALTKILEDARVLQYRNGVNMREALALAIANQRRLGHLPAAIGASGEFSPVQIAMPAASSLDALLPRDREPTIEEIREAWKECVELGSLYRGAEHYEALVAESAEPLAENR